jgi:hypothetical protein
VFYVGAGVGRLLRRPFRVPGCTGEVVGSVRSISASSFPFRRCGWRVFLHVFVLVAHYDPRREAISIPYLLVVRIAVDCVLADQLCRCLPVVSQQVPYTAVGAYHPGPTLYGVHVVPFVSVRYHRCRVSVVYVSELILLHSVAESLV